MPTTTGLSSWSAAMVSEPSLLLVAQWAERHGVDAARRLAEAEHLADGAREAPTTVHKCRATPIRSTGRSGTRQTLGQMEGAA